jgi:hypothetical protein
MVAQACPWHQVANVPFQVVCSLLAIDNRPALALLGDAMRTLREVTAAYDTASMREAYSTAYLLVALHHRRKEDDTRALAEVLRVNASDVGWVDGDGFEGGGGGSGDFGENVVVDQGNSHGQQIQQSSTQNSTQNQNQNQNQNQVLHESVAPVSDAEFSWLGDLMIDMPSLQNFDLDQFLMTDVPWPLPEMGI